MVGRGPMTGRDVRAGAQTQLAAGAAARPAPRTAAGRSKGCPRRPLRADGANQQRAHVAGFVAGLGLVHVLMQPERQKVEWWDGVR
jgi:hypothetical protein